MLYWKVGLPVYTTSDTMRPYKSQFYNVVLSSLHINVNVVAELLPWFDFVRILQHFQIH